MQTKQSEPILIKVEKVAAFAKIPAVMEEELRLRISQGINDPVTGMLTCDLSGYIHSHLAEEQEILFQVEKPKFLDWLFRRKKIVKFKTTIKDVRLNPPKLDNSVSMYFIDPIY